MLLKNVQSTKALVNGSMGRMHSITFKNGAPPDLLAAERETTFRRVDLVEPPYSINLDVDLPEGDDGRGIQSLVGGAVVVPVVAADTQDYHVSSLFAAMAGVPRLLHFVAATLTLAFAVTDFKLQGKTLDELVLSLAPRPFPPHLDIKGFYVFVSRVRRRARLRVLHKPSEEDGGFSHILALQYAPELGVWDQGYDANGDWNVNLAKVAAEAMAELRGAAPPPRASQKRKRRA